MRPSLLRAALLATTLVPLAACSRASDTSSPAIALVPPQEGRSASIVVRGLSRDELDALRDADYSTEQWQAVLRVAVSADAPPIVGDYAVSDVLEFTPAFAFDPGRPYHVAFDPARIPLGEERPAVTMSAIVSLPASHTVPSTSVARVYPTGELVPENLLRMYVEFSGPMARPSGIAYMKLLDHRGQEIEGAILPLEYEFWNREHTRFTVFLDPGRVKDGILPNRQMGRPLAAGREMTFVISREWRDEHGLPLTHDFRRTFRIGAADTTPLDPATWQVQAPAAGSRAPLRVTFSEPLDHGLLLRALGVTRKGAAIDGDITVADGEMQWTFTPREPWRSGTHHLLALDILEDLAGNQIGRAFEVDNFDTVDKSPDPTSITLPFDVR